MTPFRACALLDSMRDRRQDGFSIAELVTVVAIVSVLAAMVLPVAKMGIRRQKEIELRATLRRITEAIDRYHDLRVTGRIQDPPALGQGDYPRDLQELVDGVKLTPTGARIRLLRGRDLIDPMTGRPEWTTLSDTDDADTSMSDGNNIFEVHSTSTQLALDGKTRYSEW
jgi:general secretion pathway protein G